MLKKAKRLWKIKSLPFLLANEMPLSLNNQTIKRKGIASRLEYDHDFLSVTFSSIQKACNIFSNLKDLVFG